MEIEIYAMAIGVEGTEGLGEVYHQIEIYTETEMLLLPVTANILSDLGLFLQPPHIGQNWDLRSCPFDSHKLTP